jgi:IclR family transcriptional regulator, acetate operon repressor
MMFQDMKQTSRFSFVVHANVLRIETEFYAWSGVNMFSRSAGKEVAMARSSRRFMESAARAAPVGVISKVLRILEALHGSPTGLGLKAICDLTGIHKSTAHRFLKHLEREGYLVHTEAGAYLIGPRLAQMSMRGNQSATLQAVARPILWDLWKSTQETVNLAVLDQGTVLYVDVIESPHEFRLASRIGIRRSLHVTALGKALTAFLPADQRESILSTITFQPSTAKTIMNLVQFREELENVRRQGYAVDNEEAVQGARCVSAPILTTEGEAIGAVSVSGPVTRVSPNQVAALAGAVNAAAAAISSAMGFSRSAPETANSRRLEKTDSERP